MASDDGLGGWRDREWEVGVVDGEGLRDDKGVRGKRKELVVLDELVAQLDEEGTAYISILRRQSVPSSFTIDMYKLYGLLSYPDAFTSQHIDDGMPREAKPLPHARHCISHRPRIF